MMRSLNTQDILGAQPKKFQTNRLRYNGNISSINLATGEQIMNGTSLPNSPPKERVIAQQQQLANSYNKKSDYQQVDSVKQLLNDENDALNKEVRKVNLNITPFSNKVSNNININGGQQTSKNQINNNNSMNMNSLLKLNGDSIKKESYENLKRSLPTVNESAPRMKSDNDYNINREQKSDIEIKAYEQFSQADNGLNENNSNGSLLKQSDQNRRYSSKNTENDRYQSQPLTLSVKYPVQQGVINLFDLKKSDDQLLNRSQEQPLKNSQQINYSNDQIKQSIFLNGAQSEKNINYYQAQQQQGNLTTSNAQTTKEIHLFQTRPIDQIEIKSSPEFYHLKGISTKNNVVQVHNMFNSYRPTQLDKKGSMQNSQIQTNQNDQSNVEDEMNYGGGFYGEASPLSPKPVEIPIIDMKASTTVDGQQSQKDLLQNKRVFSQQRKIQTPITSSQNAKNKSENTKRESKKYNQGLGQTTKEQRIIVVCETSNQTREWVTRFLSMRNIQEYETFTLPGGPGCLCIGNSEERKCWQIALKQFVLNLARIYQIQEIQIYQNNNSTYSQIHQQEGVSGRGSLQQVLQENLKLACQFVKESIQLPVKGFMINNKGIVEKAL